MRIRHFRLRISPRKTKATWFHSGTRRGPPQEEIQEEDARIVVKEQLKYLGLTLDSGWGFEQHFGTLASRLERVTAALGRLLLNIGGPVAGVRRLYAEVIRSIALY